MGKTLKKNKFDIRLNFLRELYHAEISDDEIAESFNDIDLGKPQLVNFFANKCNFPKQKIFFDIKKCNTGYLRLEVEEVVKAVTSAGGIAVWAHPLGGEGEKILEPDEFYRRLEILIGCGIRGLECYYSRYTPAQENFLVNAATENNLLISGGSDYHGLNKRGIWLGKLCAEDFHVKISQLTILEKIFETLDTPHA